MALDLFDSTCRLCSMQIYKKHWWYGIPYEQNHRFWNLILWRWLYGACLLTGDILIAKRKTAKASPSTNIRLLIQCKLSVNYLTLWHHKWLDHRCSTVTRHPSVIPLAVWIPWYPQDCRLYHFYAYGVSIFLIVFLLQCIAVMSNLNYIHYCMSCSSCCVWPIFSLNERYT